MLTDNKKGFDRRLAIKAMGFGLASMGGLHAGIDGIKAAEQKHWNNCAVPWPESVRLLSSCGQIETATAEYTFKLLDALHDGTEFSLEDSHSYLEQEGYEVSYKKRLRSVTELAKARSSCEALGSWDIRNKDIERFALIAGPHDRDYDFDKYVRKEMVFAMRSLRELYQMPRDNITSFRKRDGELFLKKVQTLLQTIKEHPGSEGLLFYGGHGHSYWSHFDSDRQGEKEGILKAVKVRESALKEVVRSELGDDFQKSGSKLLIVINTCDSASFI